MSSNTTPADHTTLLPSVIKVHNPTNAPITRSVIWLHGLGADGNDFAPIVPELGLSRDLAIRFVFPHAPKMPVTINAGYVMRAWYDILEMSLERRVDVAQILASSAMVRDLIAHEVAQGIAPQHIVLAGFSQGGAIAYQTALSHPEPLAGLLALSTYIASPESINFTEAQKALPIRIDHGIQDPVVPEILGQRAAKLLQDKGYQVSYNTYPMAHQVCLPQLQQIGQWLNTVLA